MTETKRPTDYQISSDIVKICLLDNLEYPDLERHWKKFGIDLEKLGLTTKYRFELEIPTTNNEAGQDNDL